MAYTFKYADNKKYTTSDINATINQFVTGGVAEVFQNGVSLNTSDLNAIAEYVAENGTIYASSNTLKVQAYATNQVKVCAGSAFMADGATITVDAYGVILNYVSGVINYVYIKNNLTSTNTIDVVCSTTQGSGDFVPLAEISATGVITDKRTYCKGKLAGYQSDFNQPKIIDVSFSASASQTVTVDLGGYIYSRIVDVTLFDGTSLGSTMGICSIINGVKKYLCKCYRNYDYEEYTDKLNISPASGSGTNDVLVTFDIVGTNLVCNFTQNGEYKKSGTVKLMIC